MVAETRKEELCDESHTTSLSPENWLSRTGVTPADVPMLLMSFLACLILARLIDDEYHVGA
jgi:hypothetical protein